MQGNGAAEIRPRSTGEILDDAWRLYLADAAPLLVCSGLFLVPAFCVLLLLLTYATPAAVTARTVLPALAATSLALTGIGSGACQELFRLRALGKDATVRGCLRAALQHSLEHVAARGLVLCGGLLGLGCLIMPGLTIWAGSTSVHALIAAGKGRSWVGLQELGREAAFDPGKAAAVTLSRLPLLLFAVVNLYFLGAIALWIAGNLAGFDTALLGVQLSLGNPAYLTVLVLLAWLLLTPYHEAANFLLHSDTRARQEGLDLLYRVQRVFGTAVSPLPGRSLPAGVLLALAAGFLLGASPVTAAEQGTAVREVREGVALVRAEVKAADPYPGGRRWEPRLQALGRRLTEALGDARQSRWFSQALAGFSEQNQRAALLILGDLERRLTLLEETMTRPKREPGEGADGRPRLSREQIKELLRKRAEEPDGKERQAEEQARKKLERPEVKRDDPEPGPKVGGGPGLPAPQVGGAFGTLGGALLGGLVLVVLLLAVFLYWRSRCAEEKPPREKEPSAGGGLEESIQPQEQSAATWWRQAEGLAREGRHREALRALYLAVLSLLHRQHLLEYQPTRTNGEYVRQVRLAPQAPADLHRPFQTLTTFFDDRWYGDRPCDADDFTAGRRLAEEIQTQARAAV